MALATPVAALAAPLPKPSAEAIPLEQLMAGEFALQAGQLADAAQWSLEAARLARGEAFDIGPIAAICALGWMDARAPQRDWRARYPALADWADAQGQRPSVAATRPPQS